MMFLVWSCGKTIQDVRGAAYQKRNF